MRQLLKVSALFILSSLLLVACKEEAKTNTTVRRAEIKFKKEGTIQLKKADTDSLIKTLEIEIADDDYQRATGLMYRKSMQDDQGMLFVFSEEKYQNFYMKNTQISLDIIYLDSKKTIVSIVKNANPMDETSLPSEKPAQYVLEINGGLSDEWSIEIGDKIEVNTD